MTQTVDIRPKGQPNPPIDEGGDCGGCVIAGLSDYTVREAKAKFGPLNWKGIRKALPKLRAEGFLDRVIFDTPVWMPRDPSVELHWGLPSEHMATQWWDYLRMGIDGGYGAIVAVRGQGDGKLTDGLKFKMVDHYAMIRGVNRLPEVDEQGNDLSIFERSEVLYSCPSGVERWVACHEFLRNYGGFDVLMVRTS